MSDTIHAFGDAYVAKCGWDGANYKSSTHLGQVTCRECRRLLAERDARAYVEMDMRGATGAALIEKERQRQITTEGWTLTHDDAYTHGELVDAANCYVLAATEEPARSGPPPVSWPWPVEWWKPSPDPIRNLVKAGALLAADIDRLKRTAARGEGVADAVKRMAAEVRDRVEATLCPPAPQPAQGETYAKPDITTSGNVLWVGSITFPCASERDAKKAAELLGKWFDDTYAAGARNAAALDAARAEGERAGMERAAKAAEGWRGRRLGEPDTSSELEKAFGRGVDMASYYIAKDIRAAAGATGEGEGGK